MDTMHLFYIYNCDRHEYHREKKVINSETVGVHIVNIMLIK